MATGVFDRPLPDPTDEKSLLGLNNTYVITERQVAGGGVRYINFPTSDYYRQGFVIIGGGSSAKTGLYIFNGTNSSNFHVEAITAPSAGGVERDTNNRLKVTNGPSAVLNITVISTFGDKPTITST